ncbi:MAG: DUF1934 domain-containing protein [Turicibacter sp.]|nr:DUF1934 domain-containing protein [Turicibacter sp.]
MDDDKMSMNKIAGIVSFSMKVTLGLEVTETNYQTSGILYKKNDKYYLFFNETNFDDNSITKCRMEFNHEEIRIRRDGAVIIDQIYKTGDLVPGYIKTIYGQLNSEVKTHCYVLQESDTNIEFTLDYDLFVSDERSGNYKLIIQFNKEDM